MHSKTKDHDMFLANAFTVVRANPVLTPPSLASVRAPLMPKDEPTSQETDPQLLLYRSEAFAEDLDELQTCAA